MGETKMNENQGGSANLLDTTDCLEAVGVFKGWKNFFFIITILCILLLQVCFWLVDTGLISVPSKARAALTGETPIRLFSVVPALAAQTIQDANQAVSETKTEPNMPAEVNQPVMAETPTATIQPAEPNQPAMTTEQPTETMQPGATAETAAPETAQPAEEQPEGHFLFGITFDHLVWVMRFVNALVILAATLYCLTILFALKISMLGRLGGINHITRAFFLSLLALILLLPWQKIFGGVVMGAMFTSNEMVKWLSNKPSDILGLALFYLRFCGYWVLILLLLILAQIRSSRWAGAILRRLEII